MFLVTLAVTKIHDEGALLACLTFDLTIQPLETTITLELKNRILHA